MSCTDTFPVPYTIVLGGVPTGSMKAHEAAMVAVIIKSMGFSPMLTAMRPKMGPNTVIADTLLMNSVIARTIPTRANSRGYLGALVLTTGEERTS